MRSNDALLYPRTKPKPGNPGSGGVGLATFNVGDAGAAFGLSELDSRIMTVFDILRATNDQVVDGNLYDMDLALSELADRIYTMINEIGGIN